MHFLPMLLRAARELAALSLAVFCLSGCSNVYELYAPAGSQIIHATGKYEDPEQYRVKSDLYPRYHSKRSFTPPPPHLGSWISREGMADILPSDIWIVTHRIDDRLAIYSESYQSRQRKFLSGKENFIGPDLYHLLIDINNLTNHGWLVLRNPRVVIATSDRYEKMDPKLRESEGWPDESVFEATN